ncbi:MAG: GAF domain-containing protein [Anaerolineales bacterium]
MFRNRYQSLSPIERRAFWSALVTGIFATAFAGMVLDTLISAPNLQYLLANAVPFIIAILSYISAYLIIAGNVSGAAWFIQSSIILLLSATVTQAEGYGFPAAFIVLTVTLYVSMQVLSGRARTFSLWLGLAGSIGIILLDTLWAANRLPVVAKDATTATILTVALALMLIATTLAQFNNYGFRSKLIIAFALVTLIPLIVLGYYNNAVTRNILTNEAQSSLTDLSNQAASRIDTYLNIQLEDIRVQAQQPTVIAYLKLPPTERVGSPEENYAIGTLLALAQKDRGVFVRSIGLLDSRGRNVLDTSNANIGRDESNFDFYKQPVATDTAYLSNITFLRSGEGNIYFSAPVENEFGEIIGILRAEYASGIIQNQLEEQASGHLLAVVDRDTYIRIANTNRTDTLFKTFNDFSDQEIKSFQDAGRMPQGTRSTLVIPAAQFVAGLKSLSDVQYFTAISPFFDEQAVTTAKALNTEPWLIVASQSQATLLQPIAQQSRAGILLSLGILLVASIAAFFAAQILTRPITMLTGVADKIAQGDLSMRSNITTQDEIGTLSSTFNRMTGQLQDTLNDLEKRVAERSADLEMARLVSEQRAQDLQSIGEISKTISSEQQLNILLPLVSRLVSESFNFYHVGIFFLDETRQYAVLQASNSEGGKRMLERGHQLEVGQTGIVGNVAQTGRPRIALDVGADAVFFNNPDLPETRSEMALPLNVRGATIGVMDVQSTKPGAFTEADANTLSILADQVAIAIENARLFGQTQEALNEIQKLYRQYQSQEWTEFIRQSSHIGYQQGTITGKPLETPVETDEIRKALQQGEVVVIESKKDKSQPIMAIPVKLRGQTLGVLNIKAPKKKARWNQDEINLAQAISDRLALALENARLLQESQRRAAKEQKIGEMTAKIGASINMRNVLQTAVEELGRALPGSEVVIQFQPSQEN